MYRKLTLSDPILENTTRIKLKDNLPRAAQLMLSGATEVRQQPRRHAQSGTCRGAPHLTSDVVKIDQ